MNILESIKNLYTPRQASREYIVSRVESYIDNPSLSTLSIEITAAPHVIDVLRKELVGSAYRTLASSTEWEV